MNKESLGNRMKDNYENRSRFFLSCRCPTIIRVDGKAFHTLTKGFKKPFDTQFIKAMDETAFERYFKEDFWVDIDNGVFISTNKMAIEHSRQAIKNSVAYMNEAKKEAEKKVIKEAEKMKERTYEKEATKEI